MSEYYNTKPSDIEITCPDCKKTTAAEEWDNIGKRTWYTYTDIYFTLVHRKSIKALYFRCPSCKRRVAGSKIKHARIARTNREAAYRLLRKEV